MYPRKRTDSLLFRIGVALLLGMLCTGAWAKKSDRQQPMDAHADHLDGDLNDDEVVGVRVHRLLAVGLLRPRAGGAQRGERERERERDAAGQGVNPSSRGHRACSPWKAVRSGWS